MCAWRRTLHRMPQRRTTTGEPMGVSMYSPPDHFVSCIKKMKGASAL